MKINFKQFRLPLGIDRTRYQIGDARESVANMLYLNVNGIRAHALALKIYQSEGETEYSDEEIKSIMDVANMYATPAFIDGLRDMIQVNNSNNE